MNHTITAAWTATLLACCLGTPPDATAQQTPPVRITCNTDGTSAPNGVEIVKELSYTQHTLGDTYPYKDTERRFQWDKIGEWLSALEAAQQDSVTWVTLQNYKDRNGIAPEVQDPEINEYRSATDRYGVSRYQSIPLYGSQTGKPARYSRDGALFLLLKDSADYVKVCSMLYDGAWYVPKDYVRTLPVHRFSKVIFVDRTDQNIATLEKMGTVWYVRSMNPATTGLHNPPYQQETPLGVYVIQEHKPKMPETKSSLNSYLQMKKNFHTKAFQPQNFKVTKADSLDYGVGDTVRHVKFGVGIVKDIVEGGRDYEVTVDFDRFGTKKMFAAFAKLKKI